MENKDWLSQFHVIASGKDFRWRLTDEHGRASGSWKVTTGSENDDAYVARRDAEGMHASLHSSGQLHYKPNAAMRQSGAPRELAVTQRSVDADGWSRVHTVLVPHAEFRDGFVEGVKGKGVHTYSLETTGGSNATAVHTFKARDSEMQSPWPDPEKHRSHGFTPMAIMKCGIAGRVVVVKSPVRVDANTRRHWHRARTEARNQGRQKGLTGTSRISLFGTVPDFSYLCEIDLAVDL